MQEQEQIGTDKDRTALFDAKSGQVERDSCVNRGGLGGM